MKISIIIPVYNAARFLPRCFSSLDSQGFRDFGVVLVNDGSTDDSADIIAKYRYNRPFVQLIEQSNAGVSAARNAALDLALSDREITHVMFLDADDMYTPECLERTAQLAEENPGSIIEFDFDVVDENAEFKKHSTSVGNNIWSRCYPRAAVEDVRFFTGANVAEDIAFNLEIAHRHSSPVVHLHDPLYRYVINSASAMNRRFTAEDYRKRSALVEYLISMYSNSAGATGVFSRTDLPDLLRQFYRQLKHADPAERPAAEEEFRRLLKSLRKRRLLHSRKGRFKDLKYYFKFLLMSK